MCVCVCVCDEQPENVLINAVGEFRLCDFGSCTTQHKVRIFLLNCVSVCLFACSLACIFVCLFVCLVVAAPHHVI